MSHDERIGAIMAAHQRTLDLQQAMSEAAADRDTLVREAIQVGVPVTSIAQALDLHRQRIYQMYAVKR